MPDFQNNQGSFNANKNSFNEAEGLGASSGSGNVDLKILPQPPANPPIEKELKDSNAKKGGYSLLIFVIAFFVLCVMLLISKNILIYSVVFVATIVLGAIITLKAREAYSTTGLWISLIAGVISLSVVLGISNPKTVISDLYQFLKSKGNEVDSSKKVESDNKKKE